MRTLAALVLVGVAALAPGRARAQALSLTAGVSGYADAKNVALKAPQGVACTADGRIVVADTGNGRLVPFTLKDGVLAPGQEIRFGELGFPTRVQIDSRGNVLVFDQKARRIVRVDEQGKFGGVVSPKGVPKGSGWFPVAFKVDARDHLFVLEVAGARVVELDGAGAFVRQVPVPAGLSFSDIAVDPKGVIYGADQKSATVYAAGPEGEFTPFSRSLRETMSFPGYLTVTEAGLVVLVDEHGNGLVVLGRDGTFLGRRLSIGWTEGLVYYPQQICMDSAGDVIVADRGNNRLQVFATAK